MASQSGLVPPALLMLLLITCEQITHCHGFTVDPPEDLKIVDPGHLGHLEITWSPPASLMNRTDCPVVYQLEHFETYRGSWDAIRTSLRTYQAQFDLMKDVRVRVYTLLNGPCTNNTLIKSTTYTEVVLKPPATGIKDTAVQNFTCVYHNMNYTTCTWNGSAVTPANSTLHLYFWHKELEKALECRNYIFSSGARRGCNFTETKLPVFTDINVCVNGSSDQGPIEPKFITLQIQNHVKPATTEKLRLQAGSDKQLIIDWDRPAGRVPGHCLEWEVEYSQGGDLQDLTPKSIFTKETSLTLPGTKERSCFRVRSKLHKYCAEKSFWSDWSHITCHPDVEKKEVDPEPGSEPALDMVPVYVYIAVAIITVLVLVLCVGAVLKARSRQEKKQASLLSGLFGREAVPVAQA